ncbi:unnamed protein product [Hermetia illucens]|uniref:Lipase domain-containing protein n=1 Tax=Hermetia illucens TaxID=343691 RepID=A0A7R8UG51_HERIL|nr:lipase member H-A-like isoform X2 [Hermetia illucens]CAD7079402.1 unnamed protein product [Hermetia illucens]
MKFIGILLLAAGIQAQVLAELEAIQGITRDIPAFDEDPKSLAREKRAFLGLLDPPTLALFSTETDRTKYKFKDAVKILKDRNFDNQKKTVIYIHGFLEGLFAESVKAVVKTYIDRKDHNVIILDWHTQASPEYFLNAVQNVYKVGADLGTVLVDMIKGGLSLERLHIVGHSLGGQMSGVVGRTVQKVSGGKIILPRISALDPAYPGFYGIPGAEHLTASDGEYVDVLHTDSGFYGAPVPTGTVDFWPNGGLFPQPGCILVVNVCSHQRSWWYWNESLLKNSTNYFNSVTAKNWPDFKLGNVGEFNPDIVMGYGVLDNLNGNYYLQTNGASPFARGRTGIKYD